MLAPSHAPSALLPIGYSRPLSARHLVRPVLLLSSNHRPPCLGGPPTTCRNDPHGPVVLPLRRPLLLSLSLEILHFPLFFHTISSLSFLTRPPTRHLVFGYQPVLRIHIAAELSCSYTIFWIFVLVSGLPYSRAPVCSAIGDAFVQ